MTTLKINGEDIKIDINPFDLLNKSNYKNKILEGEAHLQCIGQTLKMRMPEPYVSRTHHGDMIFITTCGIPPLPEATKNEPIADIMAITRSICK